MSHVIPSQIVGAIDKMFGILGKQDALQHHRQSDVRTLLALLEHVPPNLIDLPFDEYLEFERCRSALATALPAWNLGSHHPATDVGGKNAVARIRFLAMRCRDELPPLEPEFPFVTDADTRLGIEDRVRAAWIGFQAGEWLGATTSAAVALEAVLLWEAKRIQSGQGAGVVQGKRAPDELGLDELIKLTETTGSIDADTARQARLARDARNLIHPGKIARSGTPCNKSSALAAFAAVYRVADALGRNIEKDGWSRP